MLAPSIQRAVDALVEQVTEGHRFIARGTDDLIQAAADELKVSKARVAVLEQAILKAGKTVDAADRQRYTAEARVAELESTMHEIAASIPIDDWGPDVDTSKLCTAVKSMCGRAADVEAELELLRAAGTFIASRNDGLSAKCGEGRMERALARLERLRSEGDEIGVSFQLEAIAKLRKEITRSGEGGSNG